MNNFCRSVKEAEEKSSGAFRDKARSLAIARDLEFLYLEAENLHLAWGEIYAGANGRICFFEDGVVMGDAHIFFIFAVLVNEENAGNLF